MAISRLKRYNLYTPHDSKDPKTPVHPEEEDLEVSIFDRDVTWKKLTNTNYIHQVSNVNVLPQSDGQCFTVDGQSYEIDLSDIESIFHTNKPLMDLNITSMLSSKNYKKVMNSIAKL